MIYYFMKECFRKQKRNVLASLEATSDGFPSFTLNPCGLCAEARKNRKLYRIWPLDNDTLRAFKKTKENIKNRKKHLEYTQIKTNCFLWFLGFYFVFRSPRSG